ncbi:FMN-binding protein MioC [Paraferrimonas sedimenticola]|uniref:FMN-binding protein MioC n=1 Tax=Paraferrimonas sedimenticola TaxID=375674 RepID=A0AA37RYG2_9GAMM|nr:FMN-binding protein MioC [Paraferrimonas sedimenticola]GLP97668.1 FMN-binding protein MioC [Paraferrimonas sedimenticola]
MEIIVGTTLGGAEFIADEIAEHCQNIDVATQIHSSPALDELASDQPWLFVTSTHGAGELPDNLLSFHATLEQQKPDLSQVKFAICAIGDSSYDTFCGAGKIIETIMLELGAEPIVDKIEIDIQQDPTPEDPALEWAKSWINSI